MSLSLLAPFRHHYLSSTRSIGCLSLSLSLLAASKHHYPSPITHQASLYIPPQGSVCEKERNAEMYTFFFYCCVGTLQARLSLLWEFFVLFFFFFPFYCCLRVTVTMSGFFMGRVNEATGSGTPCPGTKVNLNLEEIILMTVKASSVAKVCPKQIRGPALKLENLNCDSLRTLGQT